MKEKNNSYPLNIIFSKEKRKKKKAIHQVEGCKDARAAEERSRLYTLASLSAWNLHLLLFLFLLG
jgi:hypothetical protein